MASSNRTSLAVMLSVLVASVARAGEPPEGAVRGRIPIWGLGVQGGVSGRFFQYTVAPKFDGDAPETRSEVGVGALLGAVASVNLDLGYVVLVGGGSVSFAPPLEAEGHAGAIIGYRFWSEYAELLNASSSTYSYRTWSNKYVPTVLGAYAGAGLHFLGNGTKRALGQDVVVPGGLTPTIELGLGMASNLGLIAAVAFDPTRSTWGGRASLRAVFFGKRSLGFHVGMSFFAMAGDEVRQLPLLRLTVELGLGDGSGVFGPDDT